MALFNCLKDVERIHQDQGVDLRLAEQTTRCTRWSAARANLRMISMGHRLGDMEADLRSLAEADALATAAPSRPTPRSPIEAAAIAALKAENAELRTALGRSRSPRGPRS